MSITAERIKQARKLLGWSHLNLSLEASISLSTISNFESGKRPLTARMLGILRETLEAAGVEFIAEKHAHVRLRKAAQLAIPIEDMNASYDE